jgi:hypothetical protein
LPQPRSKLIIPHLCDHAYGESEAPHGNRLIGALSTMKGFKRFARNGFSGCGYSPSSANQVKVDASHNYNRSAHSTPKKDKGG